MKRSSLAVILGCALLAMPAGLFADGYHPAKNARQALEMVIPEINVDGTPLSKVLDFIHDYSGANMVVNWSVLNAANVDKTTPITLHLINAPIYKVLATVLDQASPSTTLTGSVDHNVITITTQEAADKVLVTKVIDIQDLLMTGHKKATTQNLSLAQSTSQSFSNGGSGGGNSGSSNTSNIFPSSASGVDAGKTLDDRGKEIVDLIEQTIRPDVWTEKGGTASIKFWHGKLIITAPQSVLDLIGE